MSIKELTDINWEAVTVDDLVKAYELKGICFEFNNGVLTDIYSALEKERGYKAYGGRIYLVVWASYHLLPIKRECKRF